MDRVGTACLGLLTPLWVASGSCDPAGWIGPPSLVTGGPPAPGVWWWMILAPIFLGEPRLCPRSRWCFALIWRGLHHPESRVASSSVPALWRPPSLVRPLGECAAPGPAARAPALGGGHLWRRHQMPGWPHLPILACVGLALFPRCRGALSPNPLSKAGWLAGSMPQLGRAQSSGPASPSKRGLMA